MVISHFFITWLLIYNVSRMLSCSTVSSCFKKPNVFSLNSKDVIDHTFYLIILLTFYYSAGFFPHLRSVLEDGNSFVFKSDSSSLPLAGTVWFSRPIHSY